MERSADPRCGHAAEADARTRSRRALRRRRATRADDRRRKFARLLDQAAAQRRGDRRAREPRARPATRQSETGLARSPDPRRSENARTCGALCERLPYDLRATTHDLIHYDPRPDSLRQLDVDVARGHVQFQARRAAVLLPARRAGEET